MSICQATPAEIANDLCARAKINEGRHLSGRMLTDDAKAMRRGAEAIRALLAINSELEQAAQGEADRFEAYRDGAER